MTSWAKDWLAVCPISNEFGCEGHHRCVVQIDQVRSHALSFSRYGKWWSGNSPNNFRRSSDRPPKDPKLKSFIKEVKFWVHEEVADRGGDFLKDVFVYCVDVGRAIGDDSAIVPIEGGDQQRLCIRGSAPSLTIFRNVMTWSSFVISTEARCLLVWGCRRSRNLPGATRRMSSVDTYWMNFRRLLQDGRALNPHSVHFPCSKYRVFRICRG